MLSWPALEAFQQVSIQQAGSDQPANHWQHIVFAANGLRMAAISALEPACIVLWGRETPACAFTQLYVEPVSLCVTQLAPSFSPWQPSMLCCLGALPC